MTVFDALPAVQEATPVFSAALGAGVLALASYDAIRTTLAPAAGAGPVTGPLARVLFMLLRGPSPRRRRRWLPAAGTVILLAGIAVWVSMLWLGWFLVFSSDADGIVEDSSGLPVDRWRRAYFTGYVLFTLGVGDVVPATALWQLLTPVATLHGFFLLTLAVTYLLQVMSAAVQRRQQAAALWVMGGSSAGILTGAWHDGSMASLESTVQSLRTALLQTVERHPAFPVLHYFHTGSSRSGFSPRVAALDEAVTLLMYAVDSSARIHAGTLQALRRTVHDLLDTSDFDLSDLDTDPSVPVPPVPDLDRLRQAGIPLEPAAEIEAAYRQLSDHRRRLHAFVRYDGWSWDDVQDGPGPVH